MTTYTYNEYLQDQMPELWQYAKENSNDPIRQVAAFLENREGKVTSRGANIFDGELDWNDRPLVRKLVTHAEIECLINVSIDKYRLDECTLYVTLEPCVDCRKVIEVLGIKSVVYGEKYIPSDATKS
jgi:deoxycytidylate deaminase